MFGSAMASPQFLFTIFFVTLGPFHAVPAFYAATHDLSEKERHGLAFKGVLVAFGTVIFVAFVLDALRQSWQIELPALIIVAGILLFIAALRTINTTWSSHQAGPNPAEIRGAHPAVSPIAIPGIVTPYGVVAVLLAVAVADNVPHLMWVVAILTLVMALNWLGMHFARPIMTTIGGPVLQVIAWCLAILQATLAVDAIISPLQYLIEHRLR